MTTLSAARADVLARVGQTLARAADLHHRGAVLATYHPAAQDDDAYQALLNITVCLRAAYAAVLAADPVLAIDPDTARRAVREALAATERATPLTATLPQAHAAMVTAPVDELTAPADRAAAALLRQDTATHRAAMLPHMSIHHTDMRFSGIASARRVLADLTRTRP